MKLTRVIKASQLANSKNKLLIKQTLDNNNLVIFPTETVYGIGANALSNKAIKKIYQTKGRPADNPLIVHIANKQDVFKYIKKPSEDALKLIDRFWPGPLTLVLTKNRLIPKTITGGLKTVAIRNPSNKVARQVLKLVDYPLTSPSAIY
jgi:L-threonylcarbamoyladenylate synthase